ncbi:MAG: hypothetical protein HFF06_08695 [Oscillospiraceae bacterium]|jgi:hypothetical protein|nr:hypothetical protein [Oscillospiraceae bacterium]
MNTKLLLQQILLPKLQPLGYQFQVLGRGNFAFVKTDQTQAIIVDHSKYLPHKLRFIFQIRPIHLEFELAKLYPGLCPSSQLTYNSQEELINYLSAVADDITDFIIAYMNIMEQNYVFSTVEQSVRLSEAPIERALRFSSRWGLSMSPYRANLLRLDEILEQMKTDIAHRKKDFFDNEDDILDLAAYFGEILSISKGFPHQWEWRNQDSPTYKRFVITASKYDPLERVIQAWNCGSELKNCSLKFFPIRGKDNSKEMILLS